MNTVKILHCADLHIGAEESFLGEKAQQRRRETLLTFEKIIDLCCEEDVKVLLIAGDLFNSNSVEQSFVTAVMEKIKSAKDLKVVFSAGNHDPYNPRSPFAKGKAENLYVFGSEESCFTFPELNLRVYGRSFETAFLSGKNEAPIANDDFINIYLVHGDLFADISSPYNSVTREFLESCKMDYVALGHIHKRSDINKIADTYFAYSGCPEGQGFDETGEKGVFIGEIGKGFCSLQFMPTAKRQHIVKSIDITNCTTGIADFILKDLEMSFGENYTQNLYKLTLTGSVAESTEIDLLDITARLENRVYFAKCKDATAPKLDLEKLSGEQTLRGIFVKKMLQKINSCEENRKELYKKALTLGIKAFDGEVKFDDN